MLTGRRFDADEALRIGLVTEVVPVGAVLEAALSNAREILSPASVQLTKQGMWIALETPSFSASVEFENRQQVITALTEDGPEVIRAFLGKRPPSTPTAETPRTPANQEYRWKSSRTRSSS
jgi:enoyl-CoA hydratase